MFAIVFLCFFRQWLFSVSFVFFVFGDSGHCVSVLFFCVFLSIALAKKGMCGGRDWVAEFGLVRVLPRQFQHWQHSQVTS